MTTNFRWAVAGALLAASCVAGMGNGSAEQDRRAMKLLQLQTLNRMASDTAPVDKDPSPLDGTRPSNGTNRSSSQMRPDNQRAPGSVTPRQP